MCYQPDNIDGYGPTGHRTAAISFWPYNQLSLYDPEVLYCIAPSPRLIFSISSAYFLLSPLILARIASIARVFFDFAAGTNAVGLNADAPAAGVALASLAAGIAVFAFFAARCGGPFRPVPLSSSSLALSEEDESPYPPNKLPSAATLSPPSSLLSLPLDVPLSPTSAALGSALPGGSGRFFSPTWNLVFGRCTGSTARFTGADARAACCAAANASYIVS
jgi:hypothetical protein